ncbi:inosine-5'-monophosphate dehydrogenase [bacterium MnTg03]|nr:inosine-5'-monophosphate dehydrogenase [bacterium MnTg03]
MQISQEALTFDDVLLVPAKSEVLPNDAVLKTRLTRGLELNIPLISAAMDTVTEYRLAISIAQEGGLGIVHKNLSIDEQAKQVARVKKYESGVIKDPITIAPDTLVRDVIDLTEKQKISGLPVIGSEGLVGIVTKRDLRFETNLDQPVSSIMTVRDKLVTVGEGAEKSEVIDLLHRHRIERLLVVSDSGELRGMITVKDIVKSSVYPLACKDDQGRLRVGAAVGTDTETEERIAALIEAEIDVIVVDTAHGHSRGVIDRVAWIKKNYPDIQVIGGNIATAAAARDLMEAGADAVKVGIGPGSICTTRIVAGVGVPQISAISNVAEALKDTDISVIADGGIRYSGDISKALVAGAHAVMIGSMFAGTEEAPGEVELFQGRSYKSYRGMGSIAAMQKGSSDRYFQADSADEKLVPEGVEGRVPYKGPLINTIHQLLGGVRSSMGYVGCRTIDELRTRPEFVKVTNAGMVESHVHDVTITKEAPNYQV